MIFCPACGMQNYPGTTHCSRCQQAFPNMGQPQQPPQAQQPWQQPQQAQQPWQQPQMPQQPPAQQPWQQQPQQPQFQPQQSQPMQPMHGAPQMAAAVTSPGSQGKKSKTGLIIGIVVGVLVVGGGVTAAVLMMGGGEKKSSTSANESTADDGDKVAAGSGTGTGTGTGSGAAGAIASALGSGSGASSGAPVPELVAIKDQSCACKDAACADKTQELFQAWSTKYKDYQGTKEQTEQVMKVAEELSACMVKAMTAGTAEAPPPTTPTTTTATSSGIPECDRYLAAIEQYASCDKIPQSARESVQGSIEQMKSGWAQMGSMPDEAKKQTADACSQGADGLVQAAQSLGCTMDVGASTTTTTTTTETTPPATTSTVQAPPKDLPNCAKYMAITEKLMKCDKMPAQAMDGLKQGLDAMSQAWTSYGSMGADIKKSLDDGCKQAADALEQVAGSLGC
jgi:hypothetical protein